MLATKELNSSVYVVVDFDGAPPAANRRSWACLVNKRSSQRHRGYQNVVSPNRAETSNSWVKDI